MPIRPKPNWKLQPSPIPGTRFFTWGDLKVFVGIEPGIGWHLSISNPHRYPTWDEIIEARYRFIPDEVRVVMHLPPRAEYINLHINCFHLHQFHDT